MRRHGLASLLAAIALAVLATPALAASTRPHPLESGISADHLGGSFTVCGRVTAFTAPVLGTPGSMTAAGVVDGVEHDFPISDTAAVDPLLAGLAAGGEWTCLDLVGDGMGVITSIVVVTTSTVQCGVLAELGGVLTQLEGSTHEFTTIVLDGDAGTIISADPSLDALMHAIATVDSPSTPFEACLDMTFGPAGTLTAVALDYEQSTGDMAPIACGMVGGTPIAYRDPASQPYPEDDTVTVDGFVIDAALLDAPYQAVLAFHLDAGLPVCLLGTVVDSVITGAAVFTLDAASVCGTLEVIGGLVFVDTVVVSQTLTSINFAEPTPSSIATACAAALAQEGAAAGTVDMCGRLDDIGTTTVTVSGITFHLTGNVIAGKVPGVGDTAGLSLVGPHPFTPFGPANPATLTSVTLDGCAVTAPAPSTVPNTASAVQSTRTPGPALAVLLAALAVLGVTALATVRVRRH
ncbi:MAG TPA: hypothetical protein VFW95_02775 [Candidatus Limnocylindria bacterium]|nr:hypothetical protein [Candidatus Limnocylindria bacterium]